MSPSIVDPLGLSELFRLPAATKPARSRTADSAYRPGGSGSFRTGSPEAQSVFARASMQRQVNEFVAPANEALQVGAQGAQFVVQGLVDLATLPPRLAATMFPATSPPEEEKGAEKKKESSGVQQERFRGPRA